MLGVRQWRHVALRHGAFCVSRQHRHFYVLFIKGWCVYSSMKQCLQSLNHEQFPIQMTKNNKWLEILDFQPKLVWRTSTEIHRLRRRRRQQEAAGKAQRTSLSTAKATSSTQRPQTCTEVATNYYNYTAKPMKRPTIGEVSVNEKLFRPRHIWNDYRPCLDWVSTDYRPTIDRYIDRL